MGMCVCVCPLLSGVLKGAGTPRREDIMKCLRQELRAGPQGSGPSANGVDTVLDSLLPCERLRADSPGREFPSPSCLSAGLLTSSSEHINTAHEMMVPRRLTKSILWKQNSLGSSTGGLWPRLSRVHTRP